VNKKRKGPKSGVNKDDFRTQRWEKQQQKIQLTAGRLFWRKGYLGTTIDDIAKAAKVNKATIYYYFKNKDFLLYEVISTAMKTVMDLTLPVADSNLAPKEKLIIILTNLIQWQLSQTGMAGIAQVEQKNLSLRLRRKSIALRDKYEEIIRDIMEKGVKQDEFYIADIKLASMFVLGMVNSIAHWYKPKKRLSSEEIASEATEFIIKALSANKDQSDAIIDKQIAGPLQ